MRMYLSLSSRLNCIRASTFPLVSIRIPNLCIGLVCLCVCVYTFLGELIKMSVEALVKEAFAV